MAGAMMDVAQGRARNEGWAPTPEFGPGPPGYDRGLSVLLIDDDLADTCLILNVLQRHPQVAAAHAIDAPESALRQLEMGQLKPDLVLLDIHMPKVSGFTVLRQIREIATAASVPVVFLTTSLFESDVARAKGSTASAYVVKPESYFELQSQLNAVLRQASAGLWDQ
jgi:two-component system response regulator AdeR